LGNYWFIALEDAEFEDRTDLTVAGVELLKARPLKL
jgi:hypothetical protein